MKLKEFLQNKIELAKDELATCIFEQDLTDASYLYKLKGTLEVWIDEVSQ